MEPTNVVQHMLLEEGNRVIEATYEALVVNAAEDNAKLPEPIFVKEFLPFFTGNVTKESRANVLATWIGIAGSPIAEVSIIDQQGRVLYTVPGIFDTSFLTLSRGRRGTNYSDIMDQTNLLSNNIPREGAKYMTEALQNKFQTLESKTPISPNEKKWLDIFNRYNIPVPGYTVDKNQTIGKNSVLDDEEY